MRQRLHPSRSCRILTLLGILSLAVLLMLPGGARVASGGASQGEQGPPASGPTPEVSITVKDEEVRFLGESSAGIAPQNLVNTGATIKLAFGNVRPNFYGLLFVSWNFIGYGTQVFASCNEGGYWNGALFTVHNIIPVSGGVYILLEVQASYAAAVVCDVFASN